MGEYGCSERGELRRRRRADELVRLSATSGAAFAVVRLYTSFPRRHRDRAGDRDRRHGCVRRVVVSCLAGRQGGADSFGF